MKKLFYLLVFLSGLIYSQEMESDQELNQNLENLKIDYKDNVRKYIDAKNAVLDIFNVFIYDGNYKIDNIKKVTKELNLAQSILQFPSDFSTEERAEELKNVFSKSMDLRVRAEKHRLIAEENMKLYKNSVSNERERVLRFFRETNYSPSEFKKKSPEEKLKLLEDFESKNINK